jgi:hypothetical protein
MRIRTFGTLALCLMGVVTSVAWADQNAGKTAPIKMTPELKMDMADMYQKMASCLRTAKTVEQCTQEVMTDCPVVKKTGHCPFTEGMSPLVGRD